MPFGQLFSSWSRGVSVRNTISTIACADLFLLLDPQLTHNIRSSALLIPHIRHLSASAASSPSSSPGSHSQSRVSSDDAGEGGQGEIAALARRILEFTDGDGPDDGASMSAGGDEEKGEEELRKSVREALRPQGKD